MALLQNKTISGVAINGCYIKVRTVSGDKNNVSATLSFAANQSAEPIAMSDVNFTPLMDGGNFIAQAYEHIKTLPEYAGAIDC
jgi:hypothetical protein